ncbi:MAG: DUF2875 family protein, partial [Zoogloea sp.]|nr:DUF2875 family protein [Zoogloea sp.]
MKSDCSGSAAKGFFRWRLVWTVLLFIAVLAGWTFYLMQIDHAVFTDSEGNSMKKWMMWLGVPVVGVLLILLAERGVNAYMIAEGEKSAVRMAAAQKKNLRRLAGEEPGQYVLEVIGLGVSLDKHRQGKLWDALQKGHPFGTIREQDPNKYSWSEDDKLGDEGSASASALENGIRGLPIYWPAPSFFATEPSEDPEWQASDMDPPIGTVAATDSNGLPFTLFIPAGYMLSDHPDRLLERAFAFFDAHPDVPYLVVAASDGLYFRHLNRPKGSPPLIYNGYYVPSMPASSALFVLARRERVEVLRPFAFEDTSIEDFANENHR